MTHRDVTRIYGVLGMQLEVIRIYGVSGMQFQNHEESKTGRLLNLGKIST